MTFKEIIDRVKRYYNPKPLLIIKLYEFNMRKQNPNETASEYVAALRKIAEHYEYGPILNNMPRHCPVCGTAHKLVQDRYLRGKKLYAEVLDTAIMLTCYVVNSGYLCVEICN